MTDQTDVSSRHLEAELNKEIQKIQSLLAEHRHLRADLLVTRSVYTWNIKKLRSELEALGEDSEAERTTRKDLDDAIDLLDGVTLRIRVVEGRIGKAAAEHVNLVEKRTEIEGARMEICEESRPPSAPVNDGYGQPLKSALRRPGGNDFFGKRKTVYFVHETISHERGARKRRFSGDSAPWDSSWSDEDEAPTPAPSEMMMGGPERQGKKRRYSYALMDPET